jgi:hypothetical protein
LLPAPCPNPPCIIPHRMAPKGVAHSRFHFVNG